jgi:hypothetical protein
MNMAIDSTSEITNYCWSHQNQEEEIMSHIEIDHHGIKTFRDGYNLDYWRENDDK